MSKTKLRPCPFCGSVDDLEAIRATKSLWWVTCGCGARGSSCGTKREASQTWNDRIGTDINDQIGCLYEIRCIIGDKLGRLMQSEVVECVRELADHFRETTKKAKRCGAEKGEK